MLLNIYELINFYFIYKNENFFLWQIMFSKYFWIHMLWNVYEIAIVFVFTSKNVQIVLKLYGMVSHAIILYISIQIRSSIRSFDLALY